MKITKATELTNANISFVSLVDKAANKKSFAIVKNDEGLNLNVHAPIIKADDEQKLVTAIVYEPMVEDSQGDYMTAKSIEKAAHSFMEKGAEIDVQHNFEKADNVTTVESWIAKEDGTIGEQEVKKGTWVMTVKVDNEELWADIQKGDITGFSMGGVAERSEEDVDLEQVEKSITKNLFSKIAKALGIEIEKGEMKDKYEQSIQRNNFWTAFDTLEYLLGHWNWQTDSFELEDDETKIKEALQDFNEIITNILTKDSVTKAMGKPVKKEETEMKKEDVQAIIKEELPTLIEKAIEKAAEPKEVEKQEEPKEEVTKEDIQAMISESVVDAVSKAMEPVLKSRGVSKQVEKKEEEVAKADEDIWNGVL